ncbi:phospholipase effector Tle1 domain-containing protein [Pigmentiphaga aceris]|nr:DUF2235 domain-containing protein [Pigmentiphaga aceris]
MASTPHISTQRCTRRAALAAGLALMLVTVHVLGWAAGAAAQCGPSLLGAPCAADGVATQAEAGASSSLAVGNPVNLATGNKYQRETDMAAAPGALGIELIRHYNARDMRTEALGRNWVWSYDTRLFRVGDTVQIVQADGSRVDFSRVPGASTCLPSDPALGVLHVQTGVRGETMSWQWRDGRVLNFDEDGFLVGISIASGQRVSIRRARDMGRHRGALLEVADPQGRQLAFRYGAAEPDGWRPLQGVDTPGGRFTYAQDAERRLSTAIRPDGDARDYLYESGSAAWLTGIVARPLGQAPQRVRSWMYDTRGRVVTAVQGAPDAQTGRQQIDYADGQTTVRDEAGAVTRLLHRQAGARTVLTSVEGAGCEGCAPIDNSRRYDALGRLTQAEGIGVTRDVLGRVMSLRDAGGATQIAWLGDSSLPTQVDAPSRVGGQRHTRHIDWLSFTDPATGVWRAVPKRISEAGWRPGADGPQAITRAWVLNWKIERGVATLSDVVPEQSALHEGSGMRAVQAAASNRSLQSTQSTPLTLLTQSEPAQGARKAGAARQLQPTKPADADAKLTPITGWPDLRWRRDDFGLPVRAEGKGGKPVAGTETRDYDAAGRLVLRLFSDGTRWTYDYNTSGQLQTHRATRAGESVETKLRWKQDLPIRIDHPVESERRGYGPDGRMAWREVFRPVASVAGVNDAAVRYAESFAWDAQGRMVRHDLPEGGSLFYAWSDQGVTDIRYAPRDGDTVLVFQQSPGLNGISRRWFNGVSSVSQAGRRLHYQGKDGVLLGLARQMGAETTWQPSSQKSGAMSGQKNGQTRDQVSSQTNRQNHDRTDAQERVAAEVVYRPSLKTPGADQAASSSGVFAVHRYAYDDAGRLIVASHAGGAGAVPAMWTPQPVDYYAWRDGGEAVAIAAQGVSMRPARLREAGGLPTRVDGHTLRYGPSRRLAAVDRGGVAVARYRHNAFGERVIREVNGKPATHDFYLGQQLVAEQGDGPLGTIARRYIYAGHEAVAILEYAGGRQIGMRRVAAVDKDDESAGQPATTNGASGLLTTLSVTQDESSGFLAHMRRAASFLLPSASDTLPVQILAVHPDAVGTPRLVTDADQTERWRGDFGPFGALRSEAGDMGMRLRLPGQVIDPETGWHDNYLRTYDPLSGAYLEPDPLGAEPGTEAYGYAAQQPAQFIDPLGLLLFAFDGTANSPQSQTNIFLMQRWYQDEDASAARVAPQHYVSGPGSQDNPITSGSDIAAAYTSDLRIEEQWRNLLNALSRFPGTREKPVQIDIIGFSRGAALARQFANKIGEQVKDGLFSARRYPLFGELITACVNLRFLGVFDTVPQMFVGATDIGWNFSIGAGWDKVAHATALHETRTLFPLTTMEVGANGFGAPASPVIEIGLIGSHSDLGGGYFYTENGKRMGDLSNVSLNWMMSQALDAGLQFANLPTAYRYVNDPALHAETNFRIPAVSELFTPVDRWVNTANSAKKYDRQDLHPLLGKSLRDQVNTFITPVERWVSKTGPVVGNVDMVAYNAWLEKMYGLRMQPSPM